VCASGKSRYFAQPLAIIVNYLNTVPTKGRKQEVGNEKILLLVVYHSSVGTEVSELCNVEYKRKQSIPGTTKRNRDTKHYPKRLVSFNIQQNDGDSSLRQVC